MINRNRLIDTFINLVQIDSPSGEEQLIIQDISQKIKAWGLKADVDSIGNMLIKVSGTGQPLLLSAHLDTVEPGRGINPRIADGIIRSDGQTVLGADNKAALAAILEILQITSEVNLNHRSLEIGLSVEEETRGGVRDFDFSQLDSQEGFCFDAAGPIGTIILSSPFISDFEIEVLGKAAHAGVEPEKGINALMIAVQAISQLPWGRIDQESTANIGLIQGGEATNTVPRRIELQGEVRSFSQAQKEKLINNIQQVFQKEAGSMGAQFNFQELPYCEGYTFSKNSALIQKTAGLFKDLGIKESYLRSQGGSDANVFNAQGITMLNLGYGAKNVHTVDEEISVESLVNLSQLILALICQDE